MEQLTKQQAGQIFGFDYKIWKDGKTYKVFGLTQDSFVVFEPTAKKVSDWSISYSEIGVSAFILARPFSDLTKEIHFSGNKFIPKEAFYREAQKLLEREMSICPGGEIIPDYLTWEIVKKLMKWNFCLNFPEGSWKDLNEMKPR